MLRNLILVSKICILSTDVLMKYKNWSTSLTFMYCMTKQYTLRTRNLSFGEKKCPPKPFLHLFCPYNKKVGHLCFNWMLPITEHMSFKRMLLRGIRDLINLSHFDPIIQMIPLIVIPLSVAHCIYQIIILLFNCPSLLVTI